MDLTPYICKGFHGDFDRAMADVPVKGIDRQQTLSMVRLCLETEDIVYGSEFSPRKIHYRHGSRPHLEQIAHSLPQDDFTLHAMHWVRDHVIHPQYTGPLAPDRAMTEEQLITSRGGWCNEQTRVFIALCEVMDLPARLCFLFHANCKTAHTASEVFLNGKWAFHDVTYGVRIQLPDGTFAEGRELQQDFRKLVHEAYRQPMFEYHDRRFNRESPCLCDWNTGGDLLDSIGICNYLIDGAEINHA